MVIKESNHNRWALTTASLLFTDGAVDTLEKQKCLDQWAPKQNRCHLFQSVKFNLSYSFCQDHNDICSHTIITCSLYLLNPFLARVLAKALKMLFCTLLNFFLKFSTFSTFSISDEMIIEIYHQIFNFQFFFWSDSIRSVQNGSKWIKLDQIWFLMK